MTDEKREHGFYWIRLRGDFADMPHRWIAGEWTGRGWIIGGLAEPLRPDHVAVVDEVTLRSPAQRYARFIPEPMRTVPAKMPMAMKAALENLDDALSGRLAVRRA